jgi:thiamine biosynthesis lipoprotein
MKAAQATEYGMNTLIIHKVFGERAEEALTAAGKEVERLEGLLSRFLPGSDIYRINKSAGRRPETVSPETYDFCPRQFNSRP